MSTGEDPHVDDAADRRDGRGDRIGIGGGDDSVTRIQLAARWAEAYAGPGDSLGGILKRFRAAYEYLDAVTHGVEPPEVDSQVARTPISAPAQAEPQARESQPERSPWAPPAGPPPEQRPWG